MLPKVMFPQEAKSLFISSCSKREMQKLTTISGKAGDTSKRVVEFGLRKISWWLLAVLLPLNLLVTCNVNYALARVESSVSVKLKEDGLAGAGDSDSFDERKSRWDSNRKINQSNFYYSANNRGFIPPVHASSMRRFGQRAASPNPDRLNLAVEPALVSLRRSEIQQASSMWSQPDPRKTYSLPLPSSSTSLGMPQTKIINHHPQLRRFSANTETTSFAKNVSKVLDSPQPVRRVTNNGNGVSETLTLIKYVPVFVGLPVSEQQTNFSPATRQTVSHPHHSVHKWTDSSSSLMSQFSLESAPEITALEPFVSVPSYRTTAYSIQPPMQQLPTTTNRQPIALSAYASRLISMLRPSALFASINTGPHINPFTHAHQHPHLYQHQHPLMNSRAQRAAIYLLAAPSENSAGVTTQHPSGSVLRGFSIDEQGAATRTTLPLATWAHQQPNGLICVHNLLQQEPPTTSHPQQQQQQQQQQVVTSGSAFDSSFEYLASGTESSARSPSETFDSGSEPVQLETAGASSPSTNTPTSTIATPTSSSTTPVRHAEKRVIQREQLKMVTTTSRPSSFLEQQQPQQQRQQPQLELFIQRPRPTIIPFTIKDKIESSPGVKVSSQTPIVQFDEPDESDGIRSAPLTTSVRPPITLPSSSNSRTTSFKSSGKSRPDVDYSRELFSPNSLPLLLASGSSRGRDKKRPPGGSRRGKVVQQSPSSNTLEQEDESASSSTESAVFVASPVSTRSTLDGQPVQLSSGPVRVVEGVSASNNLSASVTNKTKEQDEQEQRNFRSSNSRLLESLDNSMEEFARMSAALQTNPMDLIDLQNSRSSFALPAQLESLSMLSPQTSSMLSENQPTTNKQRVEAKKSRRP